MPATRRLNNVPIMDRSVKPPKEVFFNFLYVNSSNVDRIGWPVSGEPFMLVTYKGGGEYGYIGVTRQMCVAAANAESVGRYINEKIKGHYKPVRLS